MRTACEDLKDVCNHIKATFKRAVDDNAVGHS